MQCSNTSAGSHGMYAMYDEHFQIVKYRLQTESVCNGMGLASRTTLWGSLTARSSTSLCRICKAVGIQAQ